MCIAIVKTKDGMITDEQLKNCFENNPDGAGVAYSTEGQLYMIKGIFDEDSFIKSVRYAESVADGAILIHCRIATSGLVDETNCHPHVVHNNCVMIHNGVLKNITVPKDSKVSDTVLFVEGILRKLPEDFMFDEGIMNLIEVAIGGNNKFCFLHSSGEFAIANEDAGDWVNGVWFSNSSYEDAYSRYCYGYGWGKTSTTYDVDELSLTGQEWLDLERKINSLTPDELLRIGPDPVYDYTSKTLKPDWDYEDFEDYENGEYLMNVSDYLYDIYDELYNTAVDSNCELVSKE